MLNQFQSGSPSTEYLFGIYHFPVNRYMVTPGWNFDDIAAGVISDFRGAKGPRVRGKMWTAD
jgi:hypothetical protein